MARVLCTGVEETLLTTRRLILEEAGHRVVTARSAADIQRACQQFTFDVVVIGQSISLAEKRQLFEAVRKNCPNAKVLELHPSNASHSLAADDWLEVPADVPSDLAERVSELASRNP